jgi:hypothetical protein
MGLMRLTVSASGGPEAFTGDGDERLARFGFFHGEHST